MRLWTIQPAEVWDQVRTQGYADVDPARIPPCPSGEIYIPPQYYWLAEQLRVRLPGYSGRLPWGRTAAARYRRLKGNPQVRLEIETDQAVSFPIWAWNEVYCGQYLSLTEPEYTAWHQGLEAACPEHLDLNTLPEPWESQRSATWVRLFDPALPARMPHKEGLFTLTKAREAVFERINLHEVKAVTPFTGAGRY